MSYDWPSASEETLKGMGKMDQYQKKNSKVWTKNLEPCVYN